MIAAWQEFLDRAHQTSGRAGTLSLSLGLAAPPDAPDMHAHALAVMRDAPRTQLRTHAEARSLAATRELVEHAPARGQLLLLGREEGSRRFVGGISLRGDGHARAAHNLTLGMSIEAWARGRGAGALLLDASLAWARARTDARCVRLCLLASNTPARALYDSRGFLEEGRRVAYVRFEDGSFDDDVLMRLDL